MSNHPNLNQHNNLIGTPYLPPPVVPPPTVPLPHQHQHLHPPPPPTFFHAPAVPSPLAAPSTHLPPPTTTTRGRGRGRGSRGGGRGSRGGGRGRSAIAASTSAASSVSATASAANSLRLMSTLTSAAADALNDDGEFSLGENSDDDDDEDDAIGRMDVSSDDDRRASGRGGRGRGGRGGGRGGRGGRGRGRGRGGTAAAGSTPTGRKKKVVNASQAAPLDGAAGYDYQLMSDAKERDDADDEDGPVEEQVLLRLPADNPELLTKFRKKVESREDMSELKLTFTDERNGIFTFDSTTHLRTKLVDLPTILETHKSYDNKQFYKMGEIAQMLLVENLPPPTTPSEPTVFDPILYTQWPDGISPPLRRVRRDRFRRRKTNPDAEFADDMVERLLFADLNSEETLVEVCTVDEHGEPRWTGTQGTPEAALAAMGHAIEVNLSKKAAAALAAAGVTPGGGSADKGPRTAKPSVPMVEAEVERVAVNGVRVATEPKWAAGGLPAKSPSTASFGPMPPPPAMLQPGGGLTSPLSMVPPPLVPMPPAGASSSSSLNSGGSGIPPPIIPPPLVPGMLPPPAPLVSAPFLPPSTLNLDDLDLDQISVDTDDLGSADDADVDDLVSLQPGADGDDDDDDDDEAPESIFGDEDEDEDDEEGRGGSELGSMLSGRPGAGGRASRTMSSDDEMDDGASRMTGNEGTGLGESMLGGGVSQAGTAADEGQGNDDEEEEGDTDDDDDEDDEDEEDEEEEDDEQVAMLEQEVQELRQRVKETQAKLAGTANAALKKRLEDTLRKQQTELEFKESQVVDLVGGAGRYFQGNAASLDSSVQSTPMVSAQTSPAVAMFNIPGVTDGSLTAPQAGNLGRRPSVAGKGLMPSSAAAAGGPASFGVGDVESTAGASASEQGQAYDDDDDDDDDTSTHGASSYY